MPCWVRPRNARRYAQMCFEVSQQPGVKAVFLAYAYEALAQAEAAAGEKGIAYGYLTEARRLANKWKRRMTAPPCWPTLGNGAVG